MIKNFWISIIIIIEIVCISCGSKTEIYQTRTKNGITDNEITVGSSAALSGHASFLGTQLVQGSLSLINEVNSKNGIHGRKIRLISYDDGYEPDRCLENTKRLIQTDDVFILFDYVGTPTAATIINIVNEKKIPVLGLFTGAEFLRNPFQPYIINIRASYFKELEAITDFWVRRSKRRIAVFKQNDAFGAAVLSGAEIALARHKIEPVIIGGYTRGKLPDKSVVAMIASKSPDAVVMVGTYTPLAYFVKMAKDSGLKDAEFHTVSFVGSEAFAGELLRLGGDVKNNVYVTQVVPSPDDPFNAAAAEFRRLYKKYYPAEIPNYVAFEGFINAKILVETLRRCGHDLFREKLVTVIESMSDYNGNAGLISDIAPNNHTFFNDVKISTIKERSFQVIQ